MNTPPDKYELCKAERQRHIDEILQSKSRHKIVVAGPGTGKTFLFKEILKGKRSALTLTFVNSLVEDLSLELCGISEVKTLHGFARGVIGSVDSTVRIFPKLSQVIKRDAESLLSEPVNFDTIFHAMDGRDDLVEFYKTRKNLYRHYGFTDIIYAAVKYLDQNQYRIPQFDQVIVDEFQDFNTLEVTLIDLLALKSPMLIAGDDDQSLYYFKKASPGHIRDRHGNDNRYESFNLPYCSRCTRVIVESVNDVINSAEQEGFLKERINKPYLYFEDERKNAECTRYQKLSHVQCFPKQIPYFINKAIEKIAEERRDKFSVLIIAPTKSRCQSVAKALQLKGLENLSYVNQQVDDKLNLIDCLGLLSVDPRCNLGWRIAAQLYMDKAELDSLLSKTANAVAMDFVDLISDPVRGRIKRALSTFKKVRKEQTISDEDSARLCAELSLNVHSLAQDSLRKKFSSCDPRVGNPAIRNIPIKITTIPSSKGLAEDYVFILDFDDRFFLEKGEKCSDQKIYDFLVALTRARRKVFLISCDTKQPKFLTWIRKERVEHVEIGAASKDVTL